MNFLIFVCTGNTCRSPMAEAIFKKYLNDLGVTSMRVESRGISAAGEPISENAAAALREIGVYVSKRTSVPLSRAECVEADGFCAMATSHAAFLAAAGVPSGKILCLGIPDPYGGDIADYRLCRDAITKKIPEISGFSLGFSITPFRPDDAPDVAEIERECFSEPWSESALIESNMFGTSFFTAKVGREIAGYAGVRVTEDEGNMANVAVKKRFRRRGIGSALVFRACAECRDKKAKTVTLEARASNDEAIRLYEKHGFIETGRRRDFYRFPREDAVIMTKFLAGEAK